MKSEARRALLCRLVSVELEGEGGGGMREARKVFVQWAEGEWAKHDHEVRGCRGEDSWACRGGVHMQMMNNMHGHYSCTIVLEMHDEILRT